jgi:3-oxoadipate enol-lactonase
MERKRMPEAKDDHINLYYEVEGVGNPALILLHGLGSDGTAWSIVRPTLAEHYHIITPDLRGHGRTGAYDRPYTMKELADDVISLMDQVGVECANILGSSMGGMVAQCLGINYQDRVNKLILANSESFISPRLRMIIHNWIYLAENLGYRCYLENTIPWVYTEPFYNSHEEEINARIAELASRSVPSFIQAAEAVLKHDMTGFLSKISAPTLIISGELDTIATREYSELLHQEIPNSQLEIIPRTGHMAIIEKPDVFCEIVLNFLVNKPSTR